MYLIKKIILLFLLLIFSSSVQALSWAITFVVWEGKVYEVKQEIIIENSEIGKIIGEVTTKPNDRTGGYYGNASNYYPLRTHFYQIKGISTSNAIAIKEEKQWVKAVYVHKAPFHIMNLLTNQFFVFSVVILVLMIIGLIFELKSQSSSYNMVKYSKGVNGVAVTLIIVFGIVIFAGANLLIYYISKKNDKRKTKFGIFMLILSPAVFYGTLQIAAIFDNGGFGAAILALLYGALFFINGIIILWISA